jgi:hypothetical protein
MLSREAKFVTWNTCVASGSVAMAFNSDSLAPEPTPIEKTVIPALRSSAASDEVAAALLDCPVRKERESFVVTKVCFNEFQKVFNWSVLKEVF